jgi:hypothetical protein
MKLIMVAFILLNALMTSAQRQQTFETEMGLVWPGAGDWI